MPASFDLFDILCCPICKGDLLRSPDKLCCATCNRTYPIVLGIPDLRLYEDPLIPLEDDYRKGEKLEAKAQVLGFAELVRCYWLLPTYPPTPDHLKDRFIRHVLSDEDRIRTYQEKLGTGGTFLEVGCGTAAVVSVANERFRVAVGCDVAFRWLIVARKRLHERGLPAHLVCCCADYLPFRDGVFDSVASVALLEHVANAAAVVQEFSRVSSGEGRVFTWTANRFSLAPEPHVRVWGVGFVPRRWMPAYVKWRSGLAYEKKRLLSCSEVRRCFRNAGMDSIAFSLPEITAADWENLRGLERIGARIFSRISRIPVARRLLLTVSPVIQAVARNKTTAHGPALRSSTAMVGRHA